MMGFSVIAVECPTGGWRLMGVVAADLVWERKDGAPLTAADVRAAQRCERPVACRLRTWPTEAEALAALAGTPSVRRAA